MKLFKILEHDSVELQEEVSAGKHKIISDGDSGVYLINPNSPPIHLDFAEGSVAIRELLIK